MARLPEVGVAVRRESAWPAWHVARANGAMRGRNGELLDSQHGRVVDYTRNGLECLTRLRLPFGHLNLLALTQFSLTRLGWSAL